jgi:hypothetical protein
MNRRAFLLGAAMVLLCSFVAISLRSFAEAAFLGAYGAKQMPWLLIANAAGFAVATLGYDALTRVARARTVDVMLLAALALAAGAAPMLLRTGVPPGVLVVALAATSQVAGLALWNRVCAAVAGRDARRYLPRAGAAVTLGGAIAGLGAGVLIPRIGLDAVPLAGAAVTVIVIVVCIAQERTLVTGGAPGGSPGGPGMAANVGTPATPPTLLTSPQRALVAAMLAVAALEGIVTTVIDLQFIGTVKARYSGQDVAVALALFYGGTNALLFILQSAAVPRILVTRAMTFTAAVHPVIVVLAYAGVAAAPSFLGIAGTRTADQVLRFATSRTSQELELSALPPAPRGRWKVLLRGAVGPAGMAIAALALLAIGPVAVRSPSKLALVAIAIALIWAVAARIAARRFQVALAAPLGIRSTQREDARRIDLDTLERWTQAAATDDERPAALARAALARARVDAADLADHLRHDDPAVRAALFDQLARTPTPALRGELRAAISIEDDDRALALGIRALAIAGDDAGTTRGKQRAGLSRDVDEATATSERMLQGGDVTGELRRLLARDATWATAFARAHRSDFTDDTLDAALRAALAATTGGTPDRERRTNVLAVIANLAPAVTLPLLAQALVDGDPAALAAIEQLDADAAQRIARDIAAFPPLERAALARALSAAPRATSLLAALVDDLDPEVAHAALRVALAVARGGGELPASRIAAAHDAAVAAFAVHLDARDALAALGAPSAEGAAEAVQWSGCARLELDIATRRCAARLLWAAALEAAASGRDPAPIAASARHLLGTREADRKRALDVVQEQQVRPELLAALERWLGPARPTSNPGALAGLATRDPWLGRLAAGELAAIEPAIVDLRRPALFASVAGPALAALAERATRVRVTGELFAAGDEGDTMYVVTAGALVATRGDGLERRVAIGAVVGELAVLSHEPRAATLAAVDGDAEVLAIDRAAFGAASRRAPELVLGLSATLAGWLAPMRPDVL